jgi:hypothetical protein
MTEPLTIASKLSIRRTQSGYKTIEKAGAKTPAFSMAHHDRGRYNRN